MLDTLRAPRFVDLAPAEIYATLLDEGVYLCSIRTFYRVLAHHGEVRERRDQLRHPVSSLTFSLQVGLGCLVCLRSGDPAPATASSVLAMGGTGTLSARNPGSPGLCGAQMTLTLFPFAIGRALDGDPVVRLLALFVAAYAFGVWRVASQFHGDYVDMLTAQRENRERALHCGLTGLPNASHFQQSLATAGADPRNHTVAGLALDLDGFEAVNDRHGHPAGDALPQQVAGRLRQLADGSVLAAGSAATSSPSCCSAMTAPRPSEWPSR